MSIRKDVAICAMIKRRIAAPRERVFQAWTEAEHLRRWFFPTVDGNPVPHAEVDLRVGGRYRITLHAPDGNVTAMVGGTYHEVLPPAKLVFSWAWEAPQPDPSETLVTIELHEIRGETEIIITHEHFPEPTAQERHTIGWNCCLERLTQLVELASSRHVPATHQDPCRQCVSVQDRWGRLWQRYLPA
jgi:uncharacterized protein YndB with AHSA1/START domain